MWGVKYFSKKQRNHFAQQKEIVTLRKQRLRKWNTLLSFFSHCCCLDSLLFLVFRLSSCCCCASSSPLLTSPLKCLTSKWAVNYYGNNATTPAVLFIYPIIIHLCSSDGSPLTLWTSQILNLMSQIENCLSLRSEGTSLSTGFHAGV